MTVCQFSDNENYTDLEGFIVQQAPKEILLPDLPEYKNIIKVCTKNKNFCISYPNLHENFSFFKH